MKNDKKSKKESKKASKVNENKSAYNLEVADELYNDKMDKKANSKNK